MNLRVVKLGGSLLDLPDLAVRLRAWLAAQSPADTLLVVGGGRLADTIRDAQRVHGFSDVDAHWLCVRAMALQAEMLLTILPEARLLNSIEAVVQNVGNTERRLWILEPWQFLREADRRHASPLPESWDVTSDSIAARAAELCGADELVVLKSAASPMGATLPELAAEGYVDRFFPRAAQNLRAIRFVNLRAEAKEEVIVRPAEHSAP